MLSEEQKQLFSCFSCFYTGHLTSVYVMISRFKEQGNVSKEFWFFKMKSGCLYTQGQKGVISVVKTVSSQRKENRIYLDLFYLILDVFTLHRDRESDHKKINMTKTCPMIAPVSIIFFFRS